MHPFLYPFGSEERWFSYLQSCLGWDKSDLHSAQILIRKNLVPVVRGPEIATYLGVTKKLLGHMAIKPEIYYRSFHLKKKNGDLRTIRAPRVFLKTVQRYILDCILRPLDAHFAAVGFRRGLSAGDGARRHVGNKFVWNIDLKNFFPSIQKASVLKVFQERGFPLKAAYFLAGLCCYDGRLPQGAPTSPSISNLVLSSLDNRIFENAKELSIVYTRYADDLSFSCSKAIPESFQKLVYAEVRAAGFEINAAKTRLMGPLCRREVTGLTVNERLSIPRAMRRKLRARFHEVSVAPSLFTESREKLLGYASWVSEHHPDEGLKFREIALSIPARQ